MDLMDVRDISFIDIDELGVRPLNWIDDGNDIDFDGTINGYFGKEKLVELKLTTDEGDAVMPDDDDSNYEIDPETGKYAFYTFNFGHIKIETKHHVIIFCLFTFCFIEFC